MWVIYDPEDDGRITQVLPDDPGSVNWPEPLEAVNLPPEEAAKLQEPYTVAHLDEDGVVHVKRPPTISPESQEIHKVWQAGQQMTNGAMTRLQALAQQPVDLQECTSCIISMLSGLSLQVQALGASVRLPAPVTPPAAGNPPIRSAEEQCEG